MAPHVLVDSTMTDLPTSHPATPNGHEFVPIRRLAKEILTDCGVELVTADEMAAVRHIFARSSMA